MVISVIKVRAPMRFNDALELQHVHGKELESSPEKLAKLILLQHTPVYTLGRKTEPSHLLCSEDDLAARTRAEVIHTDRGGSITFHGPGQLVAYLLLNLQVWNFGIHQHLDLLEEAAINALRRFGVAGFREQGMTGIWVGEPPREKICAIGVGARRWVTYHGLALNVDVDLGFFGEMVPCGLAGKGVTSLAKVLGREMHVTEVEDALAKSFGEVYGATLETGMV